MIADIFLSTVVSEMCEFRILKIKRDSHSQEHRKTTENNALIHTKLYLKVNKTELGLFFIIFEIHTFFPKWQHGLYFQKEKITTNVLQVP